MIEQAKFAYSPLGNTFEKQTKTIEDQGKKQIKALEEHERQLVKFNELVKHLMNKDLMNLLKKDLLNLGI